MCTTTALCPLARPGMWTFLGGVTRTLNVSYLRAVPIGTTVRIRSRVLHCGKTLAMMQGTMSSVDEKTVYCTCEHHKANVPTLPEHLDFKLDSDVLDWGAEEAQLRNAAKVKL
jgi:acyl-coenzyme A thioesterase 13